MRRRQSRGRGSIRRKPGSSPTQRDVLRDLMVASRRYGLWLTLRQLAQLTGYGEASISAQLRHLRKAEYGGYTIEKRCCSEGRIRSGADRGTVWEYRLMR
jgi:hypothetical protein